MRKSPCQYCQGPTDTASNEEGSDYWNHCSKCQVYFHYATGIQDNEIVDFMYSASLFFKIGEKEFFCELLYTENRVKVFECAKLDAPIINAKTIPDWNPQNIQEKISKLLIFW